MLVLDTDHMTHLGNRGSPEWLRLTHRIEQRPDELFATTIITIAAITLIHDATLLTRNFKDFEKIPGLRVEDWTV